MKILREFNLKPKKRPDWKNWKKLVGAIAAQNKKIKVAIVGKYVDIGDYNLADSYISINQALSHAGAQLNAAVEIHWLDSKNFEKNNGNTKELKNYGGIIIPGGFGGRGVEGKIAAIQYAREHGIPFLGLCYGMQLAVIEFARNVLGIADAESEEFNAQTKNPVIHIMREQIQKLQKKKYGASMRLGAYPCVLKNNSLAQKAYGVKRISERHRHRYEFNNIYRERCENAGLIVVGVSPDNTLVEIVELKKHPFFVGVQFHPEFLSRPLQAHPLFVGLLQAAKVRSTT